MSSILNNSIWSSAPRITKKLLSLQVNSLRLLSYYELFPKTIKKSQDKWNIDLNQLRREYRKLQSLAHPDLASFNEDHLDSQNGLKFDSSLVNKAYNTLKTPLLRAQYLIELETGKNLNNETEIRELKKTVITPHILMEVMMIHEQLEDATSYDEVKSIRSENKSRMEGIETELDDCFNTNKDFNRAIELCLTLKYWTNLDQNCKDWEPNSNVAIKD